MKAASFSKYNNFITRKIVIRACAFISVIMRMNISVIMKMGIRLIIKSYEELGDLNTFNENR